MHEKYSPVGYIFLADQYCLDCIPQVVAGGIATRSSKQAGYKRGACNCAECRLDRMAEARNINRQDEYSFDSDNFPKAIPYHNDIHSECGPEGYGYGPTDPEFQKQYCNATCGKCHAVIDGVSKLDGPDVCPVFDNREDMQDLPYTMCAHCAHFVEDNETDGDPDIAPYIHLDDGDPEYDHNAEPGDTKTLREWRDDNPELFVTYADDKTGPNSALFPGLGSEQ